MGHAHAKKNDTFEGLRRCTKYLRLRRTLSRRRRPEAAGGFKAYEKAHTRALASMLATNFTAHIPEEIFPRVVAFWAHTGFYVSAAAVAALPRAAETNPNQDA